MIVKLFAFTGLRRGEVFGLQWGTVQWNPERTDERLFVRRAVVMSRVTTRRRKTASAPWTFRKGCSMS